MGKVSRSVSEAGLNVRYDYRVRSVYNEISYVQRFTKWSIKVTRQMFIYTYALRVLVIYTNWKKDYATESQKTFGIYRHFFDEVMAIRVSVKNNLIRARSLGGFTLSHCCSTFL